MLGLITQATNKGHKGGFMEENVTATAKRTARVGVSVAISSLLAHFTGNDLWLGLAPVISGVGKLLRTVFGLKFIPF